MSYSDDREFAMDDRGDQLQMEREAESREDDIPTFDIDEVFGNEEALRRLEVEHQRYRLAWTSARARAAAYADEISDLSDEREYLSDFAVGVVAERDEARAEVVRLGKQAEQLTADFEHYRRLYEQLTARVEEVRQAGIEASEREL